MHIEISIGEALDRLTILGLKLRMITDEVKLANIRAEYHQLRTAVNQQDLSTLNEGTLFLDLGTVNTKLWTVEDALRLKEQQQAFDAEFIQLARQVYQLNDERAALKREINRLTGSRLVEEKEYACAKQ